MKNNQLTEEDLINLWMVKYYKTTLQEEMSKHPPEIFKSTNWYKLYAVTQEQHDDWEKEAKALFQKRLKLSEYMMKRSWGLTYLNVSPYILKDNI